jgi:ATP-binding cassette subfamily B protein
MSFPFFYQLGFADCGPTCLRMIARFYGKDLTLNYLRDLCSVQKQGVNMLGLAGAAEQIGFDTLKVEIGIGQLFEDAPLPCILFWKNNHYVVLYRVKRSKRTGAVTKVYLADPGVGLVAVSYRSFVTYWVPEGRKRGYALLLEPRERFEKPGNPMEDQAGGRAPKEGIRFIWSYFLRYKRYFFQLILGMLAGSALSLLFPFFIKNIVDVGIHNRDLNFISLVLIFQLVLFLGNTIIEFIRNQLLLHIGSRINISIISDFLAKLMRLPIRFFDSRNIGDIINRVNDQRRIESFITGSALGTIFSVANFVLLSAVLGAYNGEVLGVFFLGSALTFSWALFFMRKRRNLDYALFNLLTANNENLYEIVNGMQEIKLNQFELYKKWEWQKHQARLFSVNLSNLKLEQYQQMGSVFFTQLKNILITFIAAQAVIRGDISLGMMLSISMIIGQMNNPFEQFIAFVKSYQFARISVERMNEIYRMDNEETGNLSTVALDVEVANRSEFVVRSGENNTESLLNSIGQMAASGIVLKDVRFQYGGPRPKPVLENLELYIPAGKTTAIVGASGSGKTTLLKLLLKFYEPQEGQIVVNGSDLMGISARSWRQQCGAVMQDGYIFSDSIKRNIITGDEDTDIARMLHAGRIACIDGFVNTLPMGYDTKIGSTGDGLSAGQKQRILIARAVYKNPAFLFFDEATSSLDANTERAIVENLYSVFRGKTVVVVAHRLSTVKNADQIIVLDQGKIVETGTHYFLAGRKGYYFNLVKNQLELGN